MQVSARHLAGVGGAMYRRAMEKVGNGEGNMHQLPGWAWLVLIADLLVFFPVFFYLGYTLSHIYPTLAIVEDPAPPAYEPLSLDADDEAVARDNALAADRPIKVDQRPTLVTSSLRRINRLLFATAGWTANFRGLACAIVLSLATGLAGGVFAAIPFVPRFLGVLLATLATVQLSTAWTHIIISAPSPKKWYHRLPPFRKTLEATCWPVLAHWAATALVGALPHLMGRAMGLPEYDPRNPMQVPEYSGSSVWKTLLIAPAVLAGTVLLVIPAQVVLVRVQASLLPPDEDTIVPFDRSYEGKVEPAIVGGKGYVSFRDAWTTFSRASWIRLCKLLGKLLLITVAAYAVFMAIFVPEIILMIKSSKPVHN